MTALPYYYSKLAPFREEFRTGAPILNYHHIAERTRGARVKWLYLKPSLFEQQLTELRAAGFSTPEYATLLTRSRPPNGQNGAARLSDAISLESSGGSAVTTVATVAPPQPMVAEASQGNPKRHVYLTFDDGFRDVFDCALPLLVQHRCRSIVFLVPSLLGKTNEWQIKVGDVAEPLMDVSQVREWLAAGQEIGAHTFTHAHLTQLSLATAREEIVASKKSLEDRFGIPVDHFNYPYGEWNQAVRDLVIEAGFKSACTIIRGVNTANTSPFELKRYIASHNLRTLKTIWKRLRVRLGLSQ